jgi:hypothetical protein
MKRLLLTYMLITVALLSKAQVNGDLYNHLTDSMKATFEARGFVQLGPKGQSVVEVDTATIRKLAKSSRRTWLVIWGTHCQPCMDDILKSRKIYKTELPDSSVRFLLVAIAYDIELIGRYMQLGYPEPIYVLKNKAFGNNIFKKTGRFRQAVYPDEPKESKKQDGYCQHYILNEKGEVIRLFAGSDDSHYPLIKSLLR